MVLHSLTDTPFGTKVTHRHYLWYQSHSRTLPVVLQLLTGTTCGTSYSQTGHSHILPVVLQSVSQSVSQSVKHFLWYQSLTETSCGTGHSWTMPVVLQSLTHFLWYFSHSQTLHTHFMLNLIKKAGSMVNSFRAVTQTETNYAIHWQSDSPDCITAFISPLLQYKQQYN